MEVKYGLSEKIINELEPKLGAILANLHLLYVKTLNYHWNLEDPRFAMLHKLFQDQYEELAEFSDLIAERIRMMGRKAPATMKRFLELATLKEGDEKAKGDQMITDLAESHEASMLQLREAIDWAHEHGDFGTADLLTDAVRAHEKSAWFLRSHL